MLNWDSYRAKVIRNAVYPLYAKYSDGRFLSYFDELEKSQWLPEETIKEIKWKKLKRLLEYSYEHVPYYKRQFDESGIALDDIRSEKEFAEIPILTKRNVQANLKQLISDKYRIEDLSENASGGSTGKPTIFYQDHNRNDLRRGYVLRHDRWSGWDIGENIALLWGADRDLTGWNNLKGRIRNFLVDRTLRLNAFDLSEEKMLEFANVLRDYKPTLIIGYANALYAFFKILKENNKTIPVPKGIVSSAETLYPWQRELVEWVSGSKVYDRYGSREVGLICSECSLHKGMHINAENVYVEIVNDGNTASPGEIGEVVVTDLLNYGMPLIRYNTEDMAVFSKCSCDCGRGLPLIDKVLGRTSDMISTKDGGLIHGEYFTHLFYGISGIRKFQLVQKKDRTILVKIEADGRIDDKRLNEVIEKIEHKMRSKEVRLSIVDKIDIPESGKHRFTISEIQHF